MCIQCRGNQGNHGLVNWYSQNMTLRDITFYNPAGTYPETSKVSVIYAQEGDTMWKWCHSLMQQLL